MDVPAAPCVTPFYRPCVVWAFLQTPLSLIDSLIHQVSQSSFSTKSSKHSQTVRARDLKCEDNVHHISLVKCHMSHVQCHVSCVIFFVKKKCLNIFLKIHIRQSAEASRWGVCYQQGHPIQLYYLSYMNSPLIKDSLFWQYSYKTL